MVSDIVLRFAAASNPLEDPTTSVEAAQGSASDEGLTLGLSSDILMSKKEGKKRPSEELISRDLELRDLQIEGQKLTNKYLRLKIRKLEKELE